MSKAEIKIPSELFSISASEHFDGNCAIDHLTVGPDEYSFKDPVHWGVDVINTGSAFLVEGQARGQGICRCSRCLNEAHIDFVGHIEEYYLTDQSKTDISAAYDDGSEEELDEDELQVLPADHVISLAQAIRSALMIAAPLLPLCKSDCAGLCPDCGANLNEKSCNCSTKRDEDDTINPDNPFSALADFLCE